MARWFLGLSSSTAAAAMTTPEDVVMPLRLTRAEAERGGSKRIALGRHGADEVLVTIPRAPATERDFGSAAAAARAPMAPAATSISPSSSFRDMGCLEAPHP